MDEELCGRIAPASEQALSAWRLDSFRSFELLELSPIWYVCVSVTYLSYHYTGMLSSSFTGSLLCWYAVMQLYQHTGELAKGSYCSSSLLASWLFSPFFLRSSRAIRRAVSTMLLLEI